MHIQNVSSMPLREFLFQLQNGTRLIVVQEVIFVGTICLRPLAQQGGRLVVLH